MAKKIASTFSSVGIPSIYLHPADSLHGDLGIVRKEDIFFIISNSGETDEVIKILPWIKRMGMRTVVMTGNRSSTIAGYGDIVLDVKVEEACPYNLVPTSSTTTALAVGDALAVALMKERNFTRDDLALLHPGGSHRQEPAPQGRGPDAHRGGPSPGLRGHAHEAGDHGGHVEEARSDGGVQQKGGAGGRHHRRRPAEGPRKIRGYALKNGPRT